MKNGVLRLKSAAQKGFTLVELLFVIAVVGILSALATPFVRELLIEGRVDPVAEDIAKVVNSMRASATASGIINPYTNLGAPAVATAAFANTALGKAQALTVNGVNAAATVQHPLGVSNSQITVAQLAPGAQFTVTLPTVNKAACPNLATALNRAAVAISINAVVVKAAGGQYNGAAGQNACTAGDTNTFIFTFE